MVALHSTSLHFSHCIVPNGFKQSGIAILRQSTQCLLHKLGLAEQILIQEWKRLGHPFTGCLVPKGMLGWETISSARARDRMSNKPLILWEKHKELGNTQPGTRQIGTIFYWAVLPPVTLFFCRITTETESCRVGKATWVFTYDIYNKVEGQVMESSEQQTNVLWIGSYSYCLNSNTITECTSSTCRCQRSASCAGILSLMGNHRGSG